MDKTEPMIWRLITLSTNTPLCQMTNVTLTLQLFTTFSAMSSGILLIPDLWTNRCIYFLNVSFCCKSRLMDIHIGQIHQMIPCICHVTQRLCSDFWSAMAIVVDQFSHSRPSKFLHQTCNKSLVSMTLVNPDFQSNPFGISRSTSCQEICFETQKERSFSQYLVKKSVSRAISSGRGSRECAPCQNGEGHVAPRKRFVDSGLHY